MASQRAILNLHGCQGGGIIGILEDTRCALHRCDNMVNPMGVLCLAVSASGSTVAHDASDMSLPVPKRELANGTFATMSPVNFLGVSITTDRMACDRRLIHSIGRKSSNPACRPRKLIVHQRPSGFDLGRGLFRRTGWGFGCKCGIAAVCNLSTPPHWWCARSRRWQEWHLLLSQVGIGM